MAILMAAVSAWATEYHGQVFYGGVPVPGATVTMTQGAKQVATVTDELGIYAFPDLADGGWKIEIRMRGFETLTGEVTVAPNQAQGRWELKLLGLEQMLAEAKAAPAEAQPQLGQRESQGGAKPKQGATKTGETNPVMPPPPSDDSDKADDGLLINGTSNNANTSRFSLAPSFGNHRPGTKGLYNGGFGAVVNSAAFDARPYSLTGINLAKAEYSRVTAVATLGGPLNIPHLFYHGPNFFVAYQWTRNSNAVTDPGLVPDAAERSGELPGAIYNPATGQTFTGPIPVSPQAAALLQYYPLPNLSGNGAGNARYNYEAQVLNHTHSDALEARLDKTLGRRDQVYGKFGLESSRGDTANVFNFRDDTDTLGLNVNANWAHQFHHQMFTTFTYNFSRLRTEARPEFENRENVSGNAGINGNDQSPAQWGPPSLVFSSGLVGLTDGNSEFNRNRTDAVAVKVSTTHRRHTVTFGGDFRRQEYNEFAEQNPRGSFAFTGAATEAPGSTPGAGNATGSDLADFLLGIPDTSQIAFGNPEKYFRTSAYDAYVTDDFRVQPTFTINAGMRWEYGAPMSELFGRMVNLDVAPGFTAVAPVLASDPKGAVTGAKYPGTLLRPDYRGWEPRVGISWRPIPASTLVVRAGYGIYDDTSVYLSSAERMAQQAPLSTSVSVANSAACPLTLANGFRNCAGTTEDTYAVDPNLRVGYAQDWQVSLQRDFPGALVVTATYLGIKGTRGTQEFLPNTVGPGGASPANPNGEGLPVGFVYRTSNGNSTRHAAELQVRRRLRSGLTATLDYTWAKALDDDAQVGAPGHTAITEATAPTSDTANDQPAAAIVAQNWMDLAGERGLSSFDQRNLLKASVQYTTGMGIGGETLLSGWRGRALKEWTVMTQITAGSGTPETPVLLEAIPGTGFTNILRPDVTGAPLYSGARGYYLNAGAYAAPAAGAWGNARRNSIIGPDEFSLDGAMARTFRVRTKWNLDVRAEASNLLNHAAWTAWNTTVNSSVFGLPAAANPMRSLQLTGRLRF